MSTNTPLDGIDEINWAELEHAYGAADKVPAWIRQLTSEDQAAREDGRYWLGASIHHQGTLYDATAPAVPFLVAFALERSTPEREWIVRFLADLAVSDAHKFEFAGFNLTAPNMAGYLDGDGAEPFRRAHDAVEGALPKLLGLLGDDDVQVRAATAFTVSFFARRAAEVRAALSTALATETEPLAIASLLMALSLQDMYLQDTSSQALMRPHLDAPSPLRLVAAAALSNGEAPGVGADSSAIEPLRESLLAEPPLEPWDGLPWYRGDVVKLALDGVFKQIPRADRQAEAAAPAIDIYFALMERARADSDKRIIDLALAAMRPLFSLVTPEPPPESGWTLETLRPSLRRFAEAVAARPFLCSRGLLDAFRENALPDDLEPLQRFLGVHLPGPLDAEIAIDGETRTVREWLGQADRIGALIEAAGRHDGAIAIAFELQCGHGDGVEVGQIDGMSFQVTSKSDGAKPPTLGELVADAAVDHDRDRAYAAALELATERAELGPPRSHGRTSRIFEGALTLLARVAARARRAGGPLPAPVFDVMTEAQLGRGHFWDRLADYYEVLPPERLSAFFLGLAERGWKKSWPEPFGISIGKELDRVLEILPDDAREALIIDTARNRDASAALQALHKYPSRAALEVVAQRFCQSVEGMENWARDDIDRQIEQSATQLAGLGLSAYAACAHVVAASDEADTRVAERALELIDARSPVSAAIHGARVDRDDRGLMPLEAARSLVSETDVYRKGEGQLIDGVNVLESDRVWAALLSLNDVDEFLEQAARIEWAFHVRGMNNLALLERYGDGILPWLASRIDEHGLLRNVPWCVAPCLVEIGSPAALEVALRVRSVDQRLPDESATELTATLEFPRSWIARHPRAYGALAELAESGNERAAELLRDRAAALGAPVYDALTEALGRERADVIADAFELPRSVLPAEVEAILEAAPTIDEPRGPLWSIAELDAAAEDFDVPLWDNANYTTGAMRVSGFASREGDVLAIEHLYYMPGANEPISYTARLFGPGAGKREVSDRVLHASEVETIEIGGDIVNGSSNLIELWGERDVEGNPIDGSKGTTIVPAALPAEHLVVVIHRALLGMRGKDVRASYLLPRSFAGLPDDEQKALELVTPAEGMLAQLCADHADYMFPFDRDLRTAAGVPAGATLLFELTDLQYPAAGEPASSSIDLVTMVEALRTRKKITELPGEANTRPEYWYPKCADVRDYAGGPAWAPGDGPIEPELPPNGAGRSPRWTHLLERGWPHGVSLMHTPEWNQPGMAEQTLTHLLSQEQPVMRVQWPRRHACMWARVCGGAQAEWSAGDPGVVAAMADDRMLHAAEAALLLRDFAARTWSPPPHVGAELVGVVEALCGPVATIDALIAALEALPDAGWTVERPALAAAVFETGYVVRRLPGERDAARARLAALIGDHTNDVARALDLISNGRVGAERSARCQLDYAHVHDDAPWAQERILDSSTTASPFDASLVTVAGPALIDRLADALADEPDPGWTATQLATLGSERAVTLVLALFEANPDARDVITAAMLERPNIHQELELGLRTHTDAARALQRALQEKRDREYEARTRP